MEDNTVEIVVISRIWYARCLNNWSFLALYLHLFRDGAIVSCKIVKIKKFQTSDIKILSNGLKHFKSR